MTSSCIGQWLNDESLRLLDGSVAVAVGDPAAAVCAALVVVVAIAIEELHVVFMFLVLQKMNYLRVV